jgi:hypothetical protein
MTNPTQVSPFPPGTVLNGDQGGTNLDLSCAPSGQYLTTTGVGSAPLQLTPIPAPPAPPAPKLSAVFVEQYASGQGAPAGNSSSFNTRALNTTVTNTIPGCVLNANHTVTLAAGTYHITATAVCVEYTANQLQIYSLTSGEVIIGGLAVAPGAGNNNASVSTAEGVLVLAGAGGVWLNHWLKTVVAGGTNTMGNPASSGDPEIYSQITIIQL